MLANQHLDKLESYDFWLNGGLLVGTIVVLTAIYIAAFSPLDLQLSEASQQSTELQELIRQISDITLKHQSLEAELAKSQQATTELLQRIPTAPRESDFLAQVCRLADRTGMEVADYHPGTVEKRENHHEMEVKVSTRGEYAALSKFLEQVDHLPRLCRLTQLDVVAAPAGETLSVEMSFRIYFAPPNEADSAKKG